MGGNNPDFCTFALHQPNVSMFIKRFLWVAALFALLPGLYSQVVITEVMYNDPSGGTAGDSLEYVEIYNAGNSQIDLSGYRLNNAVTFTFYTGTVLAPKTYLLIAKDSVKFEGVFKIKALKWATNAALNNTGETIELLDAGGSIVDQASYSSASPWPSEANGNGSSLELCDVNADNNTVTNWRAGNFATGILINGREIKATPGKANTATCSVVPASATTIAAMTADLNMDGLPDSIGKRLSFRGVVHGPDFDAGTNVNFFVVQRNANKGVNIFSTNTFNYTVTEGDSVAVVGTLGHNAGLAQITPDTVYLIRSGIPLVTAAQVVKPSEEREGGLVTIKNVTLLNPSAWNNSGNAFNVNVKNASNDTIQVRIQRGTNIFGQAPPTGTFDITGIAAQFDQSAPFTAGYQLWPRQLTDINPYQPGALYQVRTIGQVTSVKADGSADSLGLKCELNGIGISSNFRTTGVQVAMVATNTPQDGIVIFNASKDFGIPFDVGMLITVRGSITQFNGLIQITADTIIVTGQNPNGVPNPKVVTKLGEAEESTLVQINGVAPVNAADWKGASGNTTAFNANFFKGTDTTLVRIERGSYWINQPLPAGSTFNIIGVGSQFDNSNPFTSGYQLLPRYAGDLTGIVSANTPVWASAVNAYPNPMAEYLTIELPEGEKSLSVFNTNGQIVQHFSTNQSKLHLPVNSWSSGIYTIQVVHEGALVSRLLVKP